MQQKVTILIDGQNFYQGIIDNFFPKKQCKNEIKIGDIQRGLDLVEFCKHLSRGQELKCIYYFDARLNKLFPGQAIRNQQRFLKDLGKKSIVEVHLGKIEGNRQYKYQKGVDVTLATYLIKGAHSGEFNMAYLLSSDKDFCNAIQYIQHSYKNRVVNYVFFKNRFTKMLYDMARRSRKLESSDIYRFCDEKLLKQLKYYGTLNSFSWFQRRKHKSIKAKKKKSFVKSKIKTK